MSNDTTTKFQVGESRDIVISKNSHFKDTWVVNAKKEKRKKKRYLGGVAQ